MTRGGTSGLWTISFGTLFAFVAYIEMFFIPVRDLSARYTLLQSAMMWDGATMAIGSH